LKDGAVPNFSANKKLVGLQLRTAAKSASFVQISSVQHQRSASEKVFQRVREYLVDAADRTGSKALSAVAVRVELAADHFVKVRGLIKDLIAKLKAMQRLRPPRRAPAIPVWRRPSRAVTRRMQGKRLPMLRSPQTLQKR